MRTSAHREVFRERLFKKTAECQKPNGGRTFVSYSSDSRRSNIARGTKAYKQISLADQGLTRSFHWSRAISQTSFFLVF